MATQRAEALLGQPQHEVAPDLLSLPRDREDAEARVGQHDSVGGPLREQITDQRGFRDRVLAVHRADGGEQCGSAGQFMRDDQQRHRPDSRTVLIRRGRKLALCTKNVGWALPTTNDGGMVGSAHPT